MDWKEYVDMILSMENPLDNIAIQFNGVQSQFSPIVKASIVMLEKMIKSQGDKNIIVFPDKNQLLYEFLIGKVIYNINIGKIGMQYDPHTFIKGQRLKYFNCCVEFIECKVDDFDGKERIYIRLADSDRFGAPIASAPFFQIVDTKRPLSKYKAYVQAKKEEKKYAESAIGSLVNHKTHLDSSIFFVSELKSSKERLLNTYIGDKKITDYLYIAHANSDGVINNISSGQMKGNPAIILASDLFAVANAISNGIKVQSVIFDASHPSTIDNQLDLFDELSDYKFPVVCITNTVNSFNNGPLIDRGYNEWRWDSGSIVDSLYKKGIGHANSKVKNCKDQVIKYININDEIINEIVLLMYKHKADMEEQTSQLLGMYDKMFTLAFTALRLAIPIDESVRERYSEILKDCSGILDKEKKYIQKELFDDLVIVVNDLNKVLSDRYKNKKTEAIENIIKKYRMSSLCIVISERQNKDEYRVYWDEWSKNKDYNIIIDIRYPQELSSNDLISYNNVIVVGWIGKNAMRTILYGYESKEYFVLVYECEEKWKKSHIRDWRRKVDSSNNTRIIKKSLSTKKQVIEFNTDEKIEQEKKEETISNNYGELDDIERLILENRYKRYSTGGAGSSELVKAYPVSFVGDVLAFYRIGHKVITVTDIINQKDDKIVSKSPEELKVGDFVVIRESQKDIVREIADGILEKEGHDDFRELASKWKEALSVEQVFSSTDEIVEKIRVAGCKKDSMTIKNWINNDEMIIPNDLDDLMCIAKATGDEVLLEKAEKVYFAGKYVRATHGKAGRILSERLKNVIVDELHAMNDIDPFNIWDPIPFKIDELGYVIVLKVIDIGGIVPVEAGNTNRLLEE